MRSALASLDGVSDLRVPGQESPNPYVKSKGQIIQYTGDAKAEDVIAILQRNPFFKVKVVESPRLESPRGEQDGADPPTTAPESTPKAPKKPQPESEARPR